MPRAKTPTTEEIVIEPQPEPQPEQAPPEPPKETEEATAPPSGSRVVIVENRGCRLVSENGTIKTYDREGRHIATHADVNEARRDFESLMRFVK